MKNKKAQLAAVSTVLFIVLFSLGTWLSLRKPLWTDEINSQARGIDIFSYKDILLGEFPEVNLCPLFYLTQETISRIFHYRFPLPWMQEWSIYEPTSQWLLRLAPNLFMSLALMAIFIFFSLYESYWAGAFSLLMSFSSFMVWFYWVEARPYSLWFLLTTLQTILLFSILRHNENDHALWKWMIVIHLLLAFTIFFSAPQIVVVSLLLWCYKKRHLGIYIFLTYLPLAVCLFYYFSVKKLYKFTTMNLLEMGQQMFSALFYIPWEKNWLELISLVQLNVPQEWLLMLGGYAIYLSAIFIQQKREKIEKQYLTKRIDRKVFFLLPMLFWLSSLVILVYFKYLIEIKEGLVVSERYFIYLVPVFILSLTFATVDILNRFKENLWVRINLGLAVGGLVFLGALKTYLKILSLGLY